jgi:hypothetical protein
LAGVATAAWISLVRLSTWICAFMPKHHWLPFFVWCISGSRAFLAFLVEDGALMIVASTIVPVATFSSLGRQVPLHLLEQLPAQIVRFEQVAKAAYRRLVRHRLAAEIGADETAHRQRIVERLFHRRVRQVEPLLQEIDAQHPLDTDRRAAIAGLRITRLYQPAQRRSRNHALHLGQKRHPPRRLGIALKPHRCQRQLLHLPQPMHVNPPRCALYHDHWPMAFAEVP